MAKKFLTLDIGAANVVLAEYESSGKGAFKLVKYGSAALAAPLDSGMAETILSPALTEIMRDSGIKPGPVAISVSGQMVFPRFAAIPAAGGAEKFDQLVRYEIEQNVPFPIDEMVCDRQVLGDTENGDKSVMIVSAKVDQIEGITDAVTALGFRPEIVDAAPIAMVNAVNAVGGGEAGCVIILDIGAKTTSLVIVEGEKVYNRSIPIAGNTLTRDIAQALGCTMDEAEQIKREKGYVGLGGVVEDEDQVADSVSKVCRATLTRLLAEISRSVNFYRSQQGGSAPVKVYLAGGSSLLPQTDRFFAENLQVEVEYFNPFSAIAVGPAVDADAFNSDFVTLAPTFGLALHAAGVAQLAINLLPPSILAARAEKAKIPVVAAAGALLIVATVLMYLSISRDGTTVQTALEGVESKVTQLGGFEKKVKTAQAKVDEAQEEAEAMRKLLASRSAEVVHLNAIRSALVGGMWITRYGRNKVTVRGWKDRLAQVVEEDAAQNGGKRRTASEIVVSRLKGCAAIEPDSVKISEMTTIGKNSDVEQFTVELGFK